MSVVAILFLLLVVYQLKHFLADYVLQGEYMLGKFKPGWDFLKPLLAHVGVHGVMTFAIASTLLHGSHLGYAVLIGLFDATVHFFMDRIKASPAYMGRWKPLTAAEWLAAKETVRAPCLGDACGGLCDYYDADGAQQKLRGNKLFWWALGFDQAVHHLTHYACVYFILKIGGLL